MPRVFRRPSRRSAALLGGPAILLSAAAIAVAAPNGVITGSTGASGLAKVGPVSATNGFPDWYQDAKGVQLEPCYDARDVNCAGPPVPDITKPVAFPGNFPDEFFYQLDSASLTTAGGGKATIDFALEGAFVSPDVQAGQQQVFSRFRFKVTSGLQSDTTYKVTHPFGTDTLHTDAGANGIFVTQDIGATAGAFSDALASRFGPFLQWDSSAPAAPAGYLGDGQTPHKVTGSPSGQNFVRVEGPGIGGAAGATNPNPCTTAGGAPAYTGAANDCVQTDLFTVVGKKATNAGVDVDRATYSRSATGETQLQVLSSSNADQDIVVSDGDGAAGRAFPTTPLRGSDGRYVATTAVSGTLPRTVTVTNRGDIPQAVKTATLSDLVTGTAVYHLHKAGGDALHVAAASSDKGAAGPTLTVAAIGTGTATTLGSDGAADIAIAAPPATVTVRSSAGGSATIPVVVDGDALDPLPLHADAGSDQTVQQGTTVKLSAGASSGNIDSYHWAVKDQSPGSAAVSITGADSATASFTAPGAAGTYTIELTITGVGGTQTSDLVVTVVNVSTPKAAIATLPTVVDQNAPLTIDGSGSTGAARYEWSQTGGTAGAFANATAAKTTFTVPKTAAAVTLKLTVRAPGDTGSGSVCDPLTCDSATVTFTPVGDTLTLARMRFDGKGRWQGQGTASNLRNNVVTIHAGPTLASPKVGTSLVDTTGAWQIDVKGSAVGQPACNCVSLESDRGGVLLAAPMR